MGEVDTWQHPRRSSRCKLNEVTQIPMVPTWGKRLSVPKHARINSLLSMLDRGGVVTSWLKFLLTRFPHNSWPLPGFVSQAFVRVFYRCVRKRNEWTVLSNDTDTMAMAWFQSCNAHFTCSCLAMSPQPEAKTRSHWSWTWDSSPKLWDKSVFYVYKSSHRRYLIALKQSWFIQLYSVQFFK